MPAIRLLPARLLSLLAVLALAACATRGGGGASAPWADAQQMVVVTAAGWDAPVGTLRRYERDGTGWRPVGDAIDVSLGRAGSAWGLGLHPAMADGPRKREGDGRAPAGVFAIGTAFGYDGADTVRTALPYRAMDAQDWCIDVPASPLYNRIVRTSEVGEAAIEGSTEPMRRDIHADGDMLYRLGFVIEHNAQAVPQGGSCIFAHLQRAPGAPTAGCTAMPEPAMRALLGWLDPARRPVFVLIPDAEYARLQRAWQLPAR